MPWSRTKPTAAKYRSKAHTDLRKRLMAELRRNGSGRCAEPICVMRSRTITADMKLHLSHNDAGTQFLGLSHAVCGRIDENGYPAELDYGTPGLQRRPACRRTERDLRHSIRWTRDLIARMTQDVTTGELEAVG